MLAVALSESTDIEVDVYEAARQYAEIGAGVGIWQRPWKILEKLGLADELVNVTSIPHTDTPSTLHHSSLFIPLLTDITQNLPLNFAKLTKCMAQHFCRS